ncbi:MAG: hypothetical protein LPH20_11840 [Shewanella sp.]|nr:hypothetical protein [Shewanella sp.]
MEKISNRHGFSTKLILLATPLLFNQSYAYSGGCGTLHLKVSESIYQEYKLSSYPVINHGKFKGCEKADFNTGECSHFVFAQTPFAYGPNIDITFNEINGNKTAIIRVQQNYCFFEPGDMTVEAKKGRLEYKTTRGSYDADEPGVVEITSVEGE